MQEFNSEHKIEFRYKERNQVLLQRIDKNNFEIVVNNKVKFLYKNSSNTSYKIHEIIDLGFMEPSIKIF